jgi:hypothetical protein
VGDFIGPVASLPITKVIDVISIECLEGKKKIWHRGQVCTAVDFPSQNYMEGIHEKIRGKFRVKNTALVEVVPYKCVGWSIKSQGVNGIHIEWC